MDLKVRVLLVMTVAAATLWLGGCGHYVCDHTFGNATCTASGSGFSSGGGSSGSASAYVYAVDQNGTVDGYQLATSSSTFGSISSYTAPTIASNDFGVGMVVAQGKFVYAALAAQNQLYGWSVSSSGALTALSGFPLTISTMAGTIANFAYNQQVLITNPSGTLLFLSEFGDEEIYVYQINSTSGALTAVSGSPFSTLGATLEPDNMAMDGLGKYLYVTESSDDHSGSFIGIYSVSSSGALTQVGTGNYEDSIWEFAGEPSGKYMIGISGKTAFFYGQDDPHIYVYSINQSTGALTLASTNTTTYAPFNIAVSPVATNGTFVYSFSINDTDTGIYPVEGYQLNTTTGTLTALSGSPFSNIATGYWGQLDQAGSNLIVYSTATSGSGTITQLGALAVGSSGGLTQSAAAATLSTPGYWVVTDPN